MQLQHVEIGKLNLAAVNMRHGRKAPDVSDLLPSIRARGVLVPLIVRPSGEGDTFDIVAGRRRYFAAKAVAEEAGGIEPLPCAVMGQGDDAAAVETSLIENTARLDPDEVAQWEAFARLVKEGRTVADIAAIFGITDIMVKRRLALGELLPKIRNAYRNRKIDAETIRYLTLATKSQQKKWLALFEGEQAPLGLTLKNWLFGGQNISTGVSIFPLDHYTGHIVSDLFGEDEYFADPDQFWTLQSQAIAARRDAMLEGGWSGVEVLEPGQVFRHWEHVKTPKKDGGKVYITVTHSGEIQAHEGYLTPKEAKRAGREAARKNGIEGSTERETEAEPKAARPEITKAMAIYLNLHRHAAVRHTLLSHPGVALRLMVAHAIAGSGLWKTQADPQRSDKEATAESIQKARAQTEFEDERKAVLALLCLPEHGHTVVRASGDAQRTAQLLGVLLRLSDDDVMKVLAFVMSETLEAGTPVIEALGVHLNVDMADYWQPDEAFFDLLRDKHSINAMLKQVAGKRVADSNVTATAKVQKGIVRDCLDGRNNRKKVNGWLPNYMMFPLKAYTKGDALGLEKAWGSVKGYFKAA